MPIAALIYTSRIRCSDTPLQSPYSTRSYVAAAFVQLFSSTSVKELSGRIIRLTEVQVTGKQITEALTRKHSQAPSIRREESRVFEALIDHDTPGALALYCRKIWGKGQQESMLGQDTFEVADYHKATLDDLIVGGGLGEYRPLPSFVQDLMRSLFEGTDCDM